MNYLIAIKDAIIVIITITFIPIGIFILTSILETLIYIHNLFLPETISKPLSFFEIIFVLLVIACYYFRKEFFEG